MMLVWIVHTFLWAIVSICAYSLMMRVTWQRWVERSSPATWR